MQQAESRLEVLHHVLRLHGQGAGQFLDLLLAGRGLRGTINNGVRHAVQPQQILPKTGIVHQLGHMIYRIDSIEKLLRLKGLPQAFQRVGIHRSESRLASTLCHGYASFTSGQADGCGMAVLQCTTTS